MKPPSTQTLDLLPPQVAEVDEAYCMTCGHCVAVCPHGALSVRGGGHRTLPEGHTWFYPMMIGYPKFKYHRLPERKAPVIHWN